MVKSKAYRAVSVKGVQVEKALFGREGQAVEVGLDIGKAWIYAVVRFRDQTYLRPWQVGNPSEVLLLVNLLSQMSQRVKLTVGMESTGTYGDALRQAMSDAGLTLHRVSSKAAHDWSETFDGVPSQHDGKDAAIVAELCALGKSSPWAFDRGSELEQEMAYWVDQADVCCRLHQFYCGRLESRLARHWPEATEVLKVSSGTLLRSLLHWGGPAALGADPQAATTLRRFSHNLVEEQTIQKLIHQARQSVGVRLTSWDQRRMRDDAKAALAVRCQKRHATRHLAELSAKHPLLPALAKVVGVATSCVLWVCVGDPRRYDSGAAYRKAMGLNLKERSSGQFKGQLRITKRGKSMARRFLYFAAMRYVKRPPVKAWYLEKKRRDGQEGMRGIVAVLRKLPLAVYAAAHGSAFDAAHLFQSVVKEERAAAAVLRR